MDRISRVFKASHRRQTIFKEQLSRDIVHTSEVPDHCVYAGISQWSSDARKYTISGTYLREILFTKRGVFTRRTFWAYKKREFLILFKHRSSLCHFPLARSLITFLRRKIFRGCVARSQRELSRIAPRCIPVAVIKHLVIDATRVNLRYRGFTGKLVEEATCPIRFTRSFSASRLYEIS